jgi:hypothetical protein
MADGKPRFSSMPYSYDVAEGNLSGHSGWYKIGYNPDVGTSEEDLWAVGGSFVAPTGAMGLEVVSSAAADVSGNTGIGSVIIYGLDSSGVEQTETVFTSGTSAVATVRTDWTFVNGYRAVSAGTGLSAAGNIYLRHLSDTPVYSMIAQGYTRARNSNYKVPYGKTLYVDGGWVSVYGATKGVRFTMRATYDEGAGAIRTFYLPFGEVGCANGGVPFKFSVPRKFPAGVRIKVSAIADAAGAVCMSELGGWLETS